MKHSPYSVVPKPQNRIAMTISAVCFAVALIGIYGSQAVSAYPVVLQAIGLAALVASIYMLTRAQVKYIYAIEPDDTNPEENDLVIARLQGKRRTVVCRLAVKDVREIDVATAENKKALADKYHGDVVHNYCPELLPARSAYLHFEDMAPGTVLSATEDETQLPSVRIVIRISPDETLLQLLRAGAVE
jgi:hypothetical protein